MSFVVLSDEVVVTQSRRLSMNLVDLVGIADVSERHDEDSFFGIEQHCSSNNTSDNVIALNISLTP